MGWLCLASLEQPLRVRVRAEGAEVTLCVCVCVCVYERIESEVNSAIVLSENTRGGFFLHIQALTLLHACSHSIWQLSSQLATGMQMRWVCLSKAGVQGLNGA